MVNKPPADSAPDSVTVLEPLLLAVMVIAPPEVLVAPRVITLVPVVLPETVVVVAAVSEPPVVKLKNEAPVAERAIPVPDAMLPPRM